MKKLLSTIILFLLSISLSSSDKIWFSYWDDDLMGFKDNSGNIIITPRYVNVLESDKFSNITIVIEKLKNDKYSSYYLTTSGKKIHKPIYMYDNTLDTESEGFIRFRDEKNDTVGMLDKNGEVAITPIYNELQKVRNGYVVALKGAHKEYWDKHSESSCNHYSWIGGKVYLIDTKNRVLVEDYEYKSSNNLFTIKISSKPSKNPDRVNYLGKNGKYYSLIDHEKEFSNFIKDEFIADLSLDNIIKHSFKTLSYWDDELGEQYVSSKELLSNNYSLLSKKLKKLNEDNSDYFISHLEMIPISSDDKRYNFFKNDLELMEKTTYAYFEIIINQVVNDKTEQDRFTFLKINGSYKLIDIYLRSGKLR